MNIFVLDEDPEVAAEMTCDKHVVKMTLESAQILCAVSHMHGISAPYRMTHAKHPCVVWTSASLKNWQWVLRNAYALAEQYTKRYSKRHASENVLDWILLNGGVPKDGSLTSFVQAMPEQYRQADAVAAYRAYYKGEKAQFATWKSPATQPSWW
jgi:hypothetical protein